MATCALFVDYENVYKSLRGQHLNVTHKQLAEILKAETSKYGEVILARAYAPWDIFPEAMSVLDRHDIKPEYVEGGRKDNADLVMSLQIQEFLRVPGRDADTFILVTGDGDFMHVVRLLQQEKKRVVVWGVEGSISSRLMSRAADMVDVKDMLQSYGIAPCAREAAGVPVFARLPAVDDADPIRELPVRALVLRAEAVMLARGWVQVPFLTLMQEMAHPIFGQDNEQRRLLIVRCLEEGILETKKQPNPKRPGTDTTFILLKKDNVTVMSVLQNVQKVIAHCRQILQSMPGATWVAYSLLDKALAADASLPQGMTGEADRRSWIDLSIIEGVLRLEKKENPRNPEFPTSALFLTEEHPFVQQIIPGEDPAPMLRRLILAMDHYLTRTGYLWMSMGLLRQQLSQYGQQGMERSIRIANETGIIIIRQQPNQFGSRPTTGAYLQFDHPLVSETLGQRDRLLDAVRVVFQTRADMADAELLDCLEQMEALQGDAADRREWLKLLIGHQVLLPAATAGQGSYTLNCQNPVVMKRINLVSK